MENKVLAPEDLKLGYVHNLITNSLILMIMNDEGDDHKKSRVTVAAELPVCLSESLTYPSNPHATLNKMIMTIKYVQGPIMMMIYDSATCVQAGLVLRLCFF